ncbi:multicopper oxidase domain-containing protein [Nocardioides pacificus]
MTITIEPAPSPGPSRASGAARRRGFAPLRDLPALLWLMALVATTLVHPWLPAPRWLMIHLLLLGAVTHSIVVWSKHFADAVLHTPTDERELRLRNVLLATLNLGVVGVIAGVLASVWAVTLVGALAVGGAVLAHGALLLRQLRRSLPARFSGTVHYYIASASFLPVGGALGTVLARGLGDPWHSRVLLAHVVINLLGWVGITVAGTLVTLWPTMLRTRLGEGSEAASRRALPLLIVAVLVAAGGALVGQLIVVAVGLAWYVVALGLLALPLGRAARKRPPASHPTWSVLAGVTWLIGCLVGLVIALVTASGWEQAGERFDWVVPFLAAGFGAQVLLGALGYLVPMALGGGPAPVRAANEVMDRGGALRIAAANAGLVVCALPVPSLVRVLASVVALVALASSVPLLLIAIRTSHRTRTATDADRAAGVAPVRGPVGTGRPRGQVAGLASAGIAAVVLAVAVGVSLDPLALGGAGAQADAAGGATSTGETTTVQVTAEDMRFSPAVIEVPAGDRLVIEITNADDDVHDLVLESGESSGRLAAGESAEMVVDVVGRDLDGWCSVVGHRQMGMVLEVRAMGAAPAGEGSAHADHDHGPAEAEPAAEPADAGDGGPAVRDPMAVPEDGFLARDAVLPPLSDARVHRRTLTVTEVERDVAPGVSQTLWTYDGQAPGPTLHGRVGDVFVITLVNDGTIGHSIDFHAGALAPDRPMRTIAPGESLTYRFTATRAGIWMYHCSTMPMSAHIANGMFGAVVIEPRGLSEVDRSYLLVQSEHYYGPQGGPVDAVALAAEQPDAVVFNGYANQYDHDPLPAKVGERVRVWVLDAGPNRATSFHVVGGQFDAVWAEGAYLLERSRHSGAQSLGLQAAQGGFVELSFPEAGHYPFVSHVMVDAERGAHGLFDVR